MSQFKALVINNQDDNFSCQLKNIEQNFLTKQEVLIEIDYSSLNYKDALALTNSAPIAKSFPFIPGIDFAGVVIESNNEQYQVGDKVLATGFGIGERHFGGYSEQVWAKANWLTPLPKNLSMADAMFVGTGGFTAMLCVNALLKSGIDKDAGEVLVSGASGGVGSYAVAMLNHLGFNVVALTRQEKDYLRQLGAKRQVVSADFNKHAKPLDKQLWLGGIDVVGGNVLANMLSQTTYGGTVAACGLAGDFKLPTTVMPFILRGVTLDGVDSVYYPSNNRAQLWQQIADLIPSLSAINQQTVDLEQLEDSAKAMMAGEINGRVIVKVGE